MKKRHDTFPMRLRIIFLSFTLLLPFLVGCSHYRLGTGGQISFSSLQVTPVTNKTFLPQATVILGTQIRDAFIRDNRLALIDGGGADATLETTITAFKRAVSTNLVNDTGLARSFTVTLSVSCTLRDNRSGKALFENRVITVQREVYTDNGLVQAEYQSLPVMAEPLAQKILHAVVDVW